MSKDRLYKHLMRLASNVWPTAPVMACYWHTLSFVLVGLTAVLQDALVCLEPDMGPERQIPPFRFDVGFRWTALPWAKASSGSAGWKGLTQLHTSAGGMQTGLALLWSCTHTGRRGSRQQAEGAGGADLWIEVYIYIAASANW